MGKSLLLVTKTIISKSWKVDAANGMGMSLLPVPENNKSWKVVAANVLGKSRLLVLIKHSEGVMTPVNSR
jgi:hypothetical protein